MSKEKTLKSKIYNELFDSIIKGEYAPNTILSEKSLVEKFNVSKAPVREALIELCNEKVLRSIPRCGYEVVKLTDKDVEGIQQLRLILECGCLSRYWDMITPENIYELEKLLEAQSYQQGTYNVIEHWKKNSQFHLTLMSFFKNQYIYDTIKSHLTILTRAYAQFYWENMQTTEFKFSALKHWNFLSLLKSNDKYGAIKALEQDLSCFLEK